MSVDDIENDAASACISKCKVYLKTLHLLISDSLESFKTILDRLLLPYKDTPLSLAMRYRSLTYC